LWLAVAVQALDLELLAAVAAAVVVYWLVLQSYQQQSHIL
jgi:hypothetical protein